MALSKWFCPNNSRSMLVQIVHPGGRTELHDRPMLAAEVMLRNPKCCVTHPHVFREPSAIMAADEVLMLGQKYYVVPISTIRKLQRHHSRHSPSSSPSRLRRLQASKSTTSPLQSVHASQTPKHNNEVLTPRKVGAGDSCFDRLLRIAKTKAGEDPSQSSKDCSSESKEPNQKTGSGISDHWQPRLESISEEQPY